MAPSGYGSVDSWFDSLPPNIALGSDGPLASTDTINEAKRIARHLHDRLPPDTDVYVMEGGKVALEVFGSLGYGFLLVCENGGSALCIVTVDGSARRARYENSSCLPDGFVLEGLKHVRPDIKPKKLVTI